MEAKDSFEISITFCQTTPLHSARYRDLRGERIWLEKWSLLLVRTVFRYYFVVRTIGLYWEKKGLKQS